MQKTPEKVERQILALLKAGMTQKAVREKFGVGYAVIRRIVEENGLLRADRERGQGCAGSPERVASGIGRNQNERQNNRKRT